MKKNTEKYGNFHIEWVALPSIPWKQGPVNRRLIGQNSTFEDVCAVLIKDNNEKAEYLKPNIIRQELTDKALTFSNCMSSASIGQIFLI